MVVSAQREMSRAVLRLVTTCSRAVHLSLVTSLPVVSGGAEHVVRALLAMRAATARRRRRLVLATFLAVGALAIVATLTDQSFQSASGGGSAVPGGTSGSPELGMYAGNQESNV